jgi:hypothetical protein
MNKFLVFYTGITHNSANVYGHCTVECECFPSFNDTQNQLKKLHDYIDKVSITNVIKLTNDQFDAWISPPKQ